MTTVGVFDIVRASGPSRLTITGSTEETVPPQETVPAGNASVMIPKFVSELRNLNHTRFNRLVARLSLKFADEFQGRDTGGNPVITRVCYKACAALSRLHRFISLAVLLMAALPPVSAWAQKQGGILRITHRDSPASMSIHEEGTISVVLPMMGVFNNLVLFDQHARQNSLDGIVPDLAERWTWSEDGKRLTFALRQGVTWHDGKPFTAADVKCTWDLLAGTAKETLKVNFRKGWYANVESVEVNGDHEATFNLKTPQPALLALLASGFTPIYPCHVSPDRMRRAPIGTGPFKFVEYKSNQGIKVARNPSYWKPGRPYLDGIEYTIIPNRSTALLAFVSGKFDMTFPYEITVPLVGDVKTQMPEAICDISPMNVAANVLMNPVPPFDDLQVRRAVAMTLDRKSFIDILTQGQGDIGTAMQPLPEGRWGGACRQRSNARCQATIPTSRKAAKRRGPS